MATGSELAFHWVVDADNCTGTTEDVRQSVNTGQKVVTAKFSQIIVNRDRPWHVELLDYEQVIGWTGSLPGP